MMTYRSSSSHLKEEFGNHLYEWNQTVDYKPSYIQWQAANKIILNQSHSSLIVFLSVHDCPIKLQKEGLMGLVMLLTGR